MSKILRKHWIEIILCLILLTGVGLILYPTVSDRWNAVHQTRAIASYVENVESTSGENRQALLDHANTYNEKLAGVRTDFELNKEEETEYLSQLDVSGTGIMGYIEIPSIHVNLPIYHGVEAGTLQAGVGHIPGSSLPVGGSSTHCVLSGHRGLPSARLFTDLDQMEEGDVFMLHVLDETLTYQVDQIRIVLPEESEELAIVNGKDYCTLITCTPYGVNTHRILVRGDRIENVSEDMITTKEAVRIAPSIVGLAVGLPLMIIVLAGVLIYRQVKKPKRDEKEILEDLRNR